MYFINWLVISGVSASSPTYFIFLTNWAFLVFNAYLIVAAFAVTAKYISVHLICRPPEEEFSHRYEVRTRAPAGCCGYSDNSINWYQMLQWVFYLLGTELAVTITLLYWALLYRGTTIDGVNANTHLVNGICALLEVWISGIPVNTLHVIYTMIFGSVYVIFTGLYFKESEGNIVYTVVDYKNAVGQAIGICILVVLIVVPAIHFAIFYSQYKLKELILYCIFKDKSMQRDEPTKIKNGNMV